MKIPEKPALTATLLGIFLLTTADLRAAIVADFEDVTIPGGGVLHAINGSSPDGFVSGGVLFPWSSSFGLPVEFAASNISDTTNYNFNMPWDHSFNSITGGGAGGSQQYAIVNAYSTVEVDLPESPHSVAITNNTYAYYSMLHGDGFAKKFGGVDGTEPDFFRLTITGMQGSTTVGTVEFYLADFRSANGAADYLVDEWTTVDLTGLAGANRLLFSLDSSDNGSFGMNTPGYFALDNLTLAPEPTSGLTAAIAGLLGVRFARRRRAAQA